MYYVGNIWLDVICNFTVWFKYTFNAAAVIIYLCLVMFDKEPNITHVVFKYIEVLPINLKFAQRV